MVHVALAKQILGEGHFERGFLYRSAFDEAIFQLNEPEFINESH